jgi:hypothetical protein
MVNYRGQQSSRYHVHRTPAVVRRQYSHEFQHFHSTRDVRLSQSSEKKKRVSLNRMGIDMLPADNKFIGVSSSDDVSVCSILSLADDMMI